MARREEASGGAVGLVREQKCYEYFPQRLAADPYWYVRAAPPPPTWLDPNQLSLSLFLSSLVVDLGADERLWWTSHRNGRRRKEIMPSYRRLNPEELPSEYADGTANVTTREREEITGVVSTMW
jgi:hypothetical protein